MPVHDVMENGHLNGDTSLSEAVGPPLPQPIPSFKELLADVAHRYAEHLALVSMHQPASQIPLEFPADMPTAHSEAEYLRWTHAQLQYAAEILASALKRRGVSADQVIAAIIFNGVEWAVLIRAAAILECPFVPLNPRGLTNAKEIEHMLKTSNAEVLIVANSDMATKIESAMPTTLENIKLRFVLDKHTEAALVAWNGFYDLFSVGSVSSANVSADVSVRQPQIDKIVVIVFTSGTTSLPKGGIYTSSAMSASLLSYRLSMKLTPSSRTCCQMPLYHMGGVSISLAFHAAGGCVVFPSVAFDPAASLDAIAKEQCTNLPGVPAMLQAIAMNPKLKTTDLSSLKNCEMGATTIIPEHFRIVARDLRCRSASNGFAATEASPVSYGQFDTATCETVNVGSVVPGARVRICDPDTRRLVPRGQPGELFVSGHMVIKSYLRDASPDSFFFDDDVKWYRTGDQGVMAQDGTLSITGRYKDLIIRGGENIAPAAIETVLDSKLGISAQVVGVRSEEAGEVPIAVIQPRGDTQINPSEIRKAILAELGPAFVPERYYTLEELGLKDFPRTSSGKVRKIDLKAILEKRDEEAEESLVPGGAEMEAILTRLWRTVIDVDSADLSGGSSINDFADSLTVMRLRNTIKRFTGIEVTLEELLEAGTIKGQAKLLSDKQAGQSGPTPQSSARPKREGPPGVDDIAITLGSPEIYDQIRTEVSETIASYGFTWEDDVEDVLPCWDLGYEVFGSVVGTGKVNHRLALSTMEAGVSELHSAVCKALESHEMQRSFELRGLHGEPTMRVIMRPNEKWMQYAIQEIPAVEKPEDLEALLYDGVHFAQVEEPYPSFLVRVSHIKSTNTAGLIWALQHSAFDGLALYQFLEDLDAILIDPKAGVKPHISYKLWADMYYLHRTSLCAKRSVQRQIRRVADLREHQASIFPSSVFSAPPTTVGAEHRKTYIAPVLFAALPDVAKLRRVHGISPFIVVKAALATFLIRRSPSRVAVFGQTENGRSWPFQEAWVQRLMPDCMDVAGPTVERTVQLIRMPEVGSGEDSVLSFLQRLKTQQEIEAEDVHAPWSLIREGLGSAEAKALFDVAAMSTCLNYLPVRTRNGRIFFDAMRHHETKTNCETAWLYNCGMEGEGHETRMWTQILADEDLVSREDASTWAKEVLSITAWLGDEKHWDLPMSDCRVV